MLPQRFRPEGSTLPVALPPRFERFYRAQLRRVIGSRLKSRDLLDAYQCWAADAGEASMTFAEMRKLMELIGHRRIQSNGISYADVGFAATFPEVADALQVGVGGVVHADGPAPAASDLVAKIDAALASLLDLRRLVLASDEARDPAGAAARVLLETRS